MANGIMFPPVSSIRDVQADALSVFFAEGWPALLQALRGRHGHVVLFSLFLWVVHLPQIWMYTVALSVRIPLTACASLSAVALMAGQVPFTFAGLGARDVTLVVLLAGYMTPENGAAMGILIAARGLLSPLAALPIVRPYLAVVVREARGWRLEMERAG